jgi:hypothetical protein
MEGLAPRQPHAARVGSVYVRNEPPCASPISVVFGAKGLAQQALHSLNASEQDTERQQGKDGRPPLSGTPIPHPA